MNKTSNYQLNQWEATDKLSRADFNSDNAKLDAALASKAEKEALTAVETALANYKTANDAAVAKKAEQSALDSTNTALSDTNSTVAALTQTHQTDTAALNQNITALTAALGSGGKTCRVAWGSYTGTGTYGKKNPTELTFDFCPLIVLVACDNYATTGNSPCVMVRDSTTSLSVYEYDRSFDSMMNLTWTENGVSYYNTVCDYCQNNKSGCVYHYVALGYDASEQ